MGALSFTHEFPLSAADIGLIGQPLAAGMALYFLTIYVFAGATTVMLPKFDAGDYLEAVEREKVTHATTMDWMMRRLAPHPRFATTDFSSLRILHGINILSSLDPLFAQGTFCGGVTAGYASSEAGGLVTFKTPADFERCFVDPDAPLRTSCGRAGLVNEVECLDEAGAPVAVGEIGELAVRGPTLFKGYWERPEDTERALRAGWLLTGDLAYKDAEGFIYLRGRARDVVRSAGMNIYPAEVEPVLLAHPKVSEAALIGKPDAEWGEIAVACVATREPCTEEELIAFCRERLAGHKRPKRIYFFEAMPTTASGKIIKRELLALLPDDAPAGARP
jgi:acyl-CoA synthetase (AMP-forming)/AMP-acid ligase II